MIFGEKFGIKFSKKFPIVFWKNFGVKKIAWIFIYQAKKIKLVVPLQLSELRAFKWTSVTLPDL